MSTTPQANPTVDDLAREQYYANLVAQTPPPATYKGRARGKTKDSSWRTNIALWEAYPALPVAPLAKGDKPAADAWLRMEAIIVQKMFEEKPGSHAANWNPNKVTWPLPTPPASWGAGSKFAARRPWKKTVPQTRHHTGIDLAASPGTPVLAPEAGTIIAPNSGWEYNAQTGKGVKALIMQTDSGLTILLGGIRPNSAIVKAGQKVQASDKLAEVGRYPLGDSMLHFTLHDALLSEKEVNARKSWAVGQPPPANVIDPASYLAAAANNPKYSTVGFVPGNDAPGLVPNDVEGGEIFEGTEDTVPLVSASDGRTGAKPCVGKVCVKTDALAWYGALNSYLGEAKKLREYAAKLPSPTAASIAASAAIDEAASFVANSANPNGPGAFPMTWPDATQEYLGLTLMVREAIDVLTAFVASASAPGNEQAPDAPPAKPTPPVKPASSGGSIGLIAGLGAAIVVVGVVIAVASRKSTRARAAALLLILSAANGGCGPQPPPDETLSSSSGSSTGLVSPRPSSHPPTTSTTATPGQQTTSGEPDTTGPASTDSTSTTSTGEADTSSSTSSSSETTLSPPTDGCSCNTDADCPVGTCESGLCATACDPTCPVACQLGAPNMCDPPCNVPCPAICTAFGFCRVCFDHPPSGGDSAPHMTEPTGG